MDTRDIDNAFRDLYEALDLREKRKAMRSAMRQTGNTVKKAAAQEMQGKGLRHSSRIATGLRVRVYPARYGLGFMVTAKPHGKRGFYRNAQGKEKPVLMWAADGTTLRHTRNGHRRKHGTGYMPKYLDLAKVEARQTPQVEAQLFDKFVASMDKAIKKKNLT